MTHIAADTAELVRYLISALVDDPDAVSIVQSGDDERVAFQVTLDPDDVGKVIGRGGRMIKAIRTLARAAGSAQGLQVDIDIVG